jgi:seryl-tRNA synthetase
MLDIKFVRENPDVVRENITKKFQDDKLPLVDEVLKLDEEWRKEKYAADGLRAKRNKISEQINQFMKEGKKKEAKDLIQEAKEIPAAIKESEEVEQRLWNDLKDKLSKIPNIIHESVPIGKDDKDNIVEKVYGKPKDPKFEIKGHVELLEGAGLADFESSSDVAGTGFFYMEDDLALLNRALINYTIDKMVEYGFRYVETPLLLRGDVINRVTDLHDQENMIYRIENDDLALIGTSEHSLIGRFVDKEINEKELPIKHTSYSMCFRKEIGSHGIDEKGLFRTHQFNKVEMIVICKPEESNDYFEKMKKMSIEILKGLGLPIRVLKICSGDLGDLKREQVDIEVYSPRKKDYIETGSCSNLTDCQARKLGITTRIKGERVVPHTLNNTALATPRPLVAIMENNQQKDGSIKIPKVLVPYMGGKTVIGKGEK